MKIIIIGGGITGLYIGYMFKKYNIDFDIYERNNIIGGKITNQKITNHKIANQTPVNHNQKKKNLIALHKV